LPEISSALDIADETLRAAPIRAARPPSTWRRDLPPLVILGSVAAALVLGGGLDAWLWSRIDPGPFLAPQAATEMVIRESRQGLRGVESLIAAGRGTDAAALAKQILDVSPSSRAARTLLVQARQLQATESLSRTDGELVERLIGDAQRLFASGELELARLRLDRALELDPTHSRALELQIAFGELATDGEPEGR
jgi:hypothetical protein